MPEITIRPLAVTSAADDTLIQAIADLINIVFDEGEGDLLIAGHKRTNVAEIKQLVSGGEMLGAFLQEDTLIGVVRFHELLKPEAAGPMPVAGDTGGAEAAAAISKSQLESTGVTEAEKAAGERLLPLHFPSAVPGNSPDIKVGSFGMLSVLAAYRGTKLGSRLVRYVEDLARERGCMQMEIETVVPKEEPPHAFKDFLTAWYAKIGYHVVRTMALDEFREGLSKVFVRDCEFQVSRKVL